MIMRINVLGVLDLGSPDLERIEDIRWLVLNLSFTVRYNWGWNIIVVHHPEK